MSLPSAASSSSSASVPAEAPAGLARPAGSSLASTRPAIWFADEVQAHEGQLKSYLRQAFPSVRDVDDVVQESYLRVWRRHLELPIASAKAFLFQVARHLALNTLRHERASPIDDRADLESVEGVEDDLDLAERICTRQEIACLLEAIETLPRRCREVVLLRKIQGLSQKEIALRMGLSEQTVQVQASRGLKRLQRLLRSRGVIS